MSDRELKIRVITAGDPGGVNKVRDAIKETGHEATRTAPAAEKLTEGLKEQSKHSEFLALNHRQLHKIVHKLSEAFPEAGMLARAMMNPVVFAFTAAIGVFASAKEHLDELNKTLDEMGKAAAEPTFAEAIKAKRLAMEEFARGAAILKDQLAHLFDPETEYHKQIQTTIDLLHEQYAAMALLADAQKGLALENINRAERSPVGTPGHLSKEDAEIARYKVEEAAQARERARKQQESADTIGLKQTQLGHAAQMIAAKEQELEAAEKSAKAAKAKLIADEKLLEISEKQAEKVKETYQKAQAAKEADDKARSAEYERQHGLPDTRKLFGYDVEVGRTKRAVEATQSGRLFDANAARLRNLPGVVGEEETKAKLAEAAVARAQEALKAEHQRLHDLQLEVQLLRDKKAIQEDGEKGADRARAQAAAMAAIGKINASGPLGHAADVAVESSADVARRMIEENNAGRSNSASPAQQELLQSIASLLAGHDLTLQQAAQMFTGAAGNGERTLVMIEKLIATMEKFPQRAQRIEERVVNLETRVNSHTTFGSP